MEDSVTYCVCWRTIYNKEWTVFSPWFKSYADAYELMTNASKNPSCIECAVVERTETFDFVARLEKKDGKI